MEKHDGSGGKGGKRKKAPAQQIQIQQPLQQPEPPAADYQWKTEMEDSSSIAAAAAVADLRVHYDGLIKNGASAFTPTNTYILHSATNGSSSPPLQQEPPTTRYIQYDPFKPTPQLISLHQIRNYSELKEKIVEMGGQ
jgi:hypothetical protein